jgi:hypothetical protein
MGPFLVSARRIKVPEVMLEKSSQGSVSWWEGLHMDGNAIGTPLSLEGLLNRIANRDCVVGITGLGYIGLPLALVALFRLP